MKKNYLLLFLLTPFLSNAELKLNVERTSYDFNADSIEQMVQSVRELGPEANYSKAWALLETDIIAKFSVITTDKGCQFNAPEVDVVSLITLPNWRNVNDIKLETRLWWQSYTDHLLKHETKHLDIATEHALDMLNKLKSPHQGLTCKQLKKKYLSYKGDMMSRIRIADANFDRLEEKRILDNKPLFLPLSPYIGNKLEIERITLRESSWIPESVR